MPTRLIQRGLRALAGSTMLLVACQSAPAVLNTGNVRLDLVSRFDHGPATAAEIVAYDAASQRLFVVNGNLGTIDILSISNVHAPTLVSTINVSAFGTGVNSVAIKNGVIAAAVENKNAITNAHSTGQVVFFNSSGDVLANVAVGALPDMVTFTPDGKRVLVANEGEANSYGQADSVNPEGTVSIIDISAGVNAASVAHVGFSAFNGQEAALKAAGVRLTGPGATVAQDLEPEYIAVSPDGKTAYVSLQEANAFAIIDIATNTVTSIKPLGLKNHSLPGNGLDASDRDGAGGTAAIKIVNQPIFGMYQPDAIEAFEINGKTYIISANEGDSRAFTGFDEEVRVGNNSYVLDPTVFPNAATLKTNAVLGRLQLTNATGDLDGDGDFDQIHAFGARSFSIWDDAGNLVWDSGDQLEQIIAAQLPQFFNAGHENLSLDDRSDNKGPEPESVTVAELNGRLMAFIGLERIGGIVVYDITDPLNPFYVNYQNTRDLSLPISPFNTQARGDLGPEGLLYISAALSPNGQPLLVGAHEISGTTAIYQVNIIPEPATGMQALGGIAMLALVRRRK